MVGGGNVAMDAARTARRLGAASVTVAYRRGREEMPAHRAEVEDAEREGVQFAFLAAPLEVARRRARRRARPALHADGPRRARRVRPPAPRADPRQRVHVLDCDVVIVAIGMAADTRAFASLVPTNGNGTLVADPDTLQTGVPRIFAAGDVVTGPTDITRAVGEGRRAAFMIDRWLTGGAMSGFDDRLPVVDKQQVVARQRRLRAARRARRPTAPPTRRRATSTRSSRR